MDLRTTYVNQALHLVQGNVSKRLRNELVPLQHRPLLKMYKGRYLGISLVHFGRQINEQTGGGGVR